MNLVTKIGIAILSIIYLLQLSACKSPTKKKEVIANKVENTLYHNFMEVENEGSNYKIPSPMELFLYAEKNDAPYLSERVSDPNKAKQYASKYAQGLNFGIYAADLAYASAFGINQDALLFFGAAKNLAMEMGIYEGYGQEFANRINDNLHNIDSLMEISADSYHRSIGSLEQSGSTDILCLIVSGGWLEGVYILTQSAKEAPANNPLIERVADQQLLLENLIHFLEKYKDAKDVQSILNQLNALLEIFDSLYYNDENTLITQDQFVKITNKVSEIRNYIVYEL